jgi:hypothetical protein
MRTQSKLKTTHISFCNCSSSFSFRSASARTWLCFLINPQTFSSMTLTAFMLTPAPYFCFPGFLSTRSCATRSLFPSLRVAIRRLFPSIFAPAVSFDALRSPSADFIRARTHKQRSVKDARRKWSRGITQVCATRRILPTAHRQAKAMRRVWGEETGDRHNIIPCCQGRVWERKTEMFGHGEAGNRGQAPMSTYGHIENVTAALWVLGGGREPCVIGNQGRGTTRHRHHQQQHKRQRAHVHHCMRIQGETAVNRGHDRKLTKCPELTAQLLSLLHLGATHGSTTAQSNTVTPGKTLGQKVETFAVQIFFPPQIFVFVICKCVSYCVGDHTAERARSHPA